MSKVSQGLGGSRGNTYYVLRHGEAEQNVLGIVYGKDDDDYALTAEGREQVKAVAQKLSGITTIYASPIRRARESAEIAAGVLGIPAANIIIDKRLRELNFGAFQGKGIGEFIQYRNENMHTLADRFPEGESYLDAKRRFGAWLYETDLKHENEKILIVTHGIGIESLVAVAGGMTNDDTLDYVRNHTFSYAHLTDFTFSPRQVNEDFEPAAA
jgi:probable phosphoglycerate mutase